MTAYGFILEFEDLSKELIEEKLGEMAEYDIRNDNYIEDEVYDSSGEFKKEWRRDAEDNIKAHFPIYF